MPIALMVKIRDISEERYRSFAGRLLYLSGLVKLNSSTSSIIFHQNRPSALLIIGTKWLTVSFATELVILFKD